MENRLSISATEWKGYISTIWAELYGLVVEAGLRYFETTEDITADGSDSYAEPESILSTVGVDRVVNAQGERRPLYEMMAQERHRFAGRTGVAVAFAHVNRLLYLYPKPSTGSYQWLYVPQPTDLTSSADATEVDVVTPDGESFVLWGVAVQAFGKEGSDTSLARAERDEARERVMNWARMRSFHTMRRVIVEDELEWRDPADFGGNRP